MWSSAVECGAGQLRPLWTICVLNIGASALMLSRSKPVGLALFLLTPRLLLPRSRLAVVMAREKTPRTSGAFDSVLAVRRDSDGPSVSGKCSAKSSR